MPDTLLALTKPEMRDAALSTGWEEISRLRVARLMVGYIFGTTTGSVADADHQQITLGSVHTAPPTIDAP